MSLKQLSTGYLPGQVASVFACGRFQGKSYYHQELRRQIEKLEKVNYYPDSTKTSFRTPGRLSNTEQLIIDHMGFPKFTFREMKIGSDPEFEWHKKFAAWCSDTGATLKLDDTHGTVTIYFKDKEHYVLFKLTFAEDMFVL